MDSTDFRVSTVHGVVVTHYDERIVNTIPHAREVKKNGQTFLTVPHRRNETKVLNNLGYPVGAPILHHYDWAKTTPFESQRDTARLLTENPRAYVLNDMGTGKTRASLFACDYLMGSREISRVLIAAPLSTLTTVWEREIFSVFPNRRAITLHGTRAKRLALLEEEADFYIINHDGMVVLEDALQDRVDINAIILDELAVLRNSKTKRWKAINRLCQTRRFVWGMTGSPTPKAPTDAYGQVKLLTPQNVPKFFKAFQNETMWQATQFKWLPRKDANDVVHRVMQPSVRYTRDDCIDLPPTTYSTREVEMSAQQKAAYKQMMDEFTVEYAEVEITAANAGVQASKLIQIGAGFTYGSNGVVVDLECESRIRELTELIDEASNKVIVFTPFKHSVDFLKARLDFYGYDVARIHGGVGKGERDRIFNLFRDTTSIQVLVAHPQTMAHGLTLTSADTIIWYAPLWNLEIYEQANARITRPGQVNHTHIIHIQSSPVEKRVYATLEKRGNMQAALLNLFR